MPGTEQPRPSKAELERWKADFRARQGPAPNSKAGKLLAKARPHLDSDETPLCSVLCTYETRRMKTKTVRNGILIATDKRVVFYAKRVTGHEIKHFRYKAISSIDTGKNMMGHYISLIVSGNEINVKWIKEGAEPLIEAIQRQMDNL